MATLSKTFDPSKFSKKITKSLTNISTGFNDPTDWISTGNYALNKRISGDFFRGIPLGKISMFSGQSGAGKSYVVSGSIIKNAQKQGIFCVVIDTENALDEAWLQAVGVDTSPDKIMRISASMIDDVAKIIGDFVADYKAEYESTPREERPKVLFVVDSLGMLLTPTDVAQFTGGDMKGDMGRKAKQLKALMTNITNMIGSLNIGLAVTNHSYANQDQYNGEGAQITSGGSGAIYSSSILVMMKKLKLKTDETGKKTTETHGIRAVCEVIKTRYAKPFERVEIEIPFSTGMDEYSGLFTYFKSKSLLEKSGKKHMYVDKDGNEHLYYEKEYNNNKDGILDLIMSEWSDDIEERDQVDTDDDDYDDDQDWIIVTKDN